MKQKQTIQRNVFRLRWWAALVLIVAFIPATKSLAQHEGEQSELETARERIHAMMREAEELQDAGRVDAADHMRKEAHKMANRIEEHLSQRRRHEQAEQDQEREHLHNVLEGLERGMAALRELGRHEELEALERVVHEVRQEIEGRRDRPQRKRRRERRGEGNEREMAMHQLEIMRLAMPALREGERRDAADLLERAIHARELALEGRRDEEAQQIRKHAPNRAQLAEILGLSSRLWREFDNKERAQAVGQLAEQMSERAHRQRDERAQREQDRPRRQARDRREDHDRHEAREWRADRDRHDARERHEQSDRYQAAMERIERLEAQIKRLGAAMERLQGQLHQRDRDRR
ncbi:MAG: hypothetical protein IH984_11090 [Planctomycetes bacterium]|nr:hypothetical protein [Planctomycetota bacterium]